MRQLLPILLLLTAFSVYGQKTVIQDGKLNGILPVNESGKVTYLIVDSVAGATKGELFKRARKWFVKTYNSANQVIQVNDLESGELTGKGFFSVSDSFIGARHIYPIRHLLTVDVKQGKYRITLTDLVVDDRGGSFAVETVPTMGRKWIDKFYTKINVEASAMLTSLQKALATSDDF